MDQPTDVDHRRPGRWGEILRPLRDKPGEWHRVEGSIRTPTVTNVNSIANNIRRGAYTGIAPGEFEARVKWPSLFVRFVGAANEREVA